MSMAFCILFAIYCDLMLCPNKVANNMEKLKSQNFKYRFESLLCSHIVPVVQKQLF